jgi:molybdenum storage protein
MPTGVLAKLGSSISEQNALMIAILLSQRGGIKIAHDDLVKLPNYMMPGIIPVTHAMPPYGLFERPPALGRIPPHRTDAGAFLLAEVMGAELYLIKDEHACTLIPRKIRTRSSFLKSTSTNCWFDLKTGCRTQHAESLKNARSVREAFVVNGLVQGATSRARWLASAWEHDCT